MSDQLAEKIRKMVAEQLGVDDGDVSAQSNILDDLGADSLDVVELVLALEDEFEISVPDEAIETMATVHDVQTYIATRLAPE